MMVNDSKYTFKLWWNYLSHLSLHPWLSITEVSAGSPPFSTNYSHQLHPRHIVAVDSRGSNSSNLLQIFLPHAQERRGKTSQSEQREREEVRRWVRKGVGEGRNEMKMLRLGCKTAKWREQIRDGERESEREGGRRWHYTCSEDCLASAVLIMCQDGPAASAD
ncbi:hypothetical protein QQF64_017530 [Cirrhinus molitorella]|uniref:Uncharacterized protein n=1 Tax=Cirrhinus molitorella TaxID=172907 RepID=A0ABR3LMJ1_9TELE